MAFDPSRRQEMLAALQMMSDIGPEKRDFLLGYLVAKHLDDAIKGMTHLLGTP